MKNSFLQWQKNHWEENNLFPPELEPQKAIHFLVDYLLGEDWYFVEPVNAKQGNVYILHAILRKYSFKYRKELKKLEKQIKKRSALKEKKFVKK